MPRKKTANPVQKKVSELLAISDVRVILIINALVSMAYDLQNFMFPFYGHAIGLSAAEIGWLIGVFYAATFIVRFFIAFICQTRLGVAVFNGHNAFGGRCLLCLSLL